MSSNCDSKSVRRGRPTWVLALALLLITSGSTCLPTVVAAADEPFLLTLATDGTVFRLGEPIFLDITVKNTSAVPKAFSRDPVDLDLGVLNAKHEMIVPNKSVEVYSLQPLGTVLQDPAVHLAPGEIYYMPYITMERLGVRITEPGPYTAYLVCQMRTGPVFSNTISFTVR